MIYIGLVRDRANKRRNLVMSFYISLIPSSCYLGLVLLTAYRLAMRNDALAKSGERFLESRAEADFASHCTNCVSPSITV